MCPQRATQSKGGNQFISEGESYSRPDKKDRRALTDGLEKSYGFISGLSFYN